MPSEDGNQIFTFSKFLNHRKRRWIWVILVKWDGLGYEPSWQPLSNMKEADPITCATYARENNLLEEKGWKWAKRNKVDASKLIRLSKCMFAGKRTDEKYKFGVCVPKGVSKALELYYISTV